ncbi:MAG: GerMN domain-containing protein [Acidimicrobiia bacterium]
MTAPTVIGVPRSAEGPDVLKGSMQALLEGPTSEEKAKGYSSWFSSETAGMLNEVTLEEGTARIDFDDLSKVIPNASSSCGGATLLAQLDSTAKQFPTVRKVIYSIDGDPDRFYSWLQLDTPN